MYAIDPAELARAYPFVETSDARHEARRGASRNSETEPDDAAILRLRLSLLVDERDRERTAAEREHERERERERERSAATIADLLMRLDRAEQHITALISNQEPKKKTLGGGEGRNNKLMNSGCAGLARRNAGYKGASCGIKFFYPFALSRYSALHFSRLKPHAISSMEKLMGTALE